MSSDNGMRSNLDRRKFLHAAGRSVAAGLLLLAFTVAMTFSLGIKALLDYFVPSAAAILLSSRDSDRFALDAWSRAQWEPLARKLGIRIPVLLRDLMIGNYFDGLTN